MSTGFGLASLCMVPKCRKEMAQISFFVSLVTSPLSFPPRSFCKEAGARSSSSVSALHLSLCLFALVSADISARDALSSRAEISFFYPLRVVLQPAVAGDGAGGVELTLRQFFLWPPRRPHL